MAGGSADVAAAAADSAAAAAAALPGQQQEKATCKVSICFIARISGTWLSVSFPDAPVPNQEQLVAVALPIARIVETMGADGHLVRRESSV